MSQDASWRTRVRRVVDSALIEPVPRDHQQSDREFHRRRIVVVVTLVVGASLLGVSLATKPGDPVFYPLTAGVAVVWIAGGLASGPLHLGYIMSRGSRRRPIALPIALGLISGAIFVVGAVVVREIDPLRNVVAGVLAHAQQAQLAAVLAITLLNGVAEEVFFRGALFAAIGQRHPVPISVAVYTLVTIAIGNLMLVFAAAVMGTVFALQRRASGGILAPMLTHLVWSTIMLLALPPVLGVS